jgi:hypothetical protein
MSDTNLSQTFSDAVYWPIHVKMYIKSMERMAQWLGRDEEDIENLCQLTFYNGLRGEVRQWFDGLTLETQES